MTEMIQIIKDGKPLQIQSVGFVVDGDIVILSKNVIKGGSIAAQEFDNMFYENLKQGARTHEEAYEKAELAHESVFEIRRYSSFESYKNTLSKRIK
jgi:hypothetical protein